MYVSIPENMCNQIVWASLTQYSYKQGMPATNIRDMSAVKHTDHEYGYDKGCIISVCANDHQAS